MKPQSNTNLPEFSRQSIQSLSHLLKEKENINGKSNKPKPCILHLNRNSLSCILYNCGSHFPFDSFSSDCEWFFEDDEGNSYGPLNRSHMNNLFQSNKLKNSFTFKHNNSFISFDQILKHYYKVKYPEKVNEAMEAVNKEKTIKTTQIRNLKINHTYMSCYSTLMNSKSPENFVLSEKIVREGNIKDEWSESEEFHETRCRSIAIF